MARVRSVRIRTAQIAAVICWGIGLATGSLASSEGSGPTNRLAGEASPYLQMHKHNPVDWYPWGDEAFEKARAEQKPIFLSVGYSTCFWCHVMERKVFSNPEIAAQMNRDFVNIKVDREERPDIDEIYMTATHLMTGSGGWPNSVFLTPDGEPFFAGTYFPPEDSGRRPGFPRVLAQLSDAWQNRRDEVLAVAARTRRQIEQQSAAPVPANLSFDPNDLLLRATRQMEQGYDTRYGGFSTRTKFPSPPKLEMLLAAHRAKPDSAALAMLTHTLDEMALGGIYDHLAGGFHRYSTEPSWSIPHYEKMLYDNGQLLGVYAQTYEQTRKPLYRQVVIGIARYLEREMLHPDGGFYSAQDAEVDAHEGKSYLWTRAQIEAVLGEKRTDEFLSVYRLAPMSEGEGMALRVALPIEPAIERLGAKNAAELLDRFAADRQKLLAVRNARKQPLRDDKILAGWNGLTIRGLVLAARAIGRPDYLRLAEAAADFTLEHLRDSSGQLHRSYIAGQLREQGVLDDYAYLADALLELHRATGDPARLAQAQSLTDLLLGRFEDPAAGGFFLTAKSTELFARPRRVYDNVKPSGSGVALRVLIGLAEQTPESRYRDASSRTIESFGSAFDRSPSQVGTAVVAVASIDSVTPPARPIAGAMPGSKDHVHIRVKRAADSASELAVEIRVDEGWHINANPASMPFLIPTTIALEGGTLSEPIQYPAGVVFAPSFSPEPLSTYQGTLEIALHVSKEEATPQTANEKLPSGKNTSAKTVSVRYQACDESRCLPPATSRAAIP
ncbi:MAG: thioredoxin domain-containing protein [Myxococcota bacterium]